jgi:hypothetical protein
MIDMESRLETSEAYEISQSLYDAFLRFTRDQGWDKFFTTWVAGEWYTGQHSPIGHAIEGGLVRLLALVMEYAKLKVRPVWLPFSVARLSCATGP